jgi:hypothetical protein
LSFETTLEVREVKTIGAVLQHAQTDTCSCRVFGGEWVGERMMITKLEAAMVLEPENSVDWQKKD